MDWLKGLVDHTATIRGVGALIADAVLAKVALGGCVANRPRTAHRIDPGRLTRTELIQRNLDAEARCLDRLSILAVLVTRPGGETIAGGIGPGSVKPDVDAGFIGGWSDRWLRVEVWDRCCLSDLRVIGRDRRYWQDIGCCRQTRYGEHQRENEPHGTGRPVEDAGR